MANQPVTSEAKANGQALAEMMVDMGDGTHARRIASVPVSSSGAVQDGLPARADVTPSAVPVYASGKAGTARDITASTTSQTLMAAMTTRGKFIVSNDSTVDVWINTLGRPAVAAAGGGNKKIAANGGYFELSGYTGAVTIIAASGTAAITALEL